MAKTLTFRRNGTEFEAWLGKKKVGQAFVKECRPTEYILEAIDIYEQYQRKGYGTQLMRFIADFLRSSGATMLRSSNEGSGTVQMLDKVFGRENCQHFHAGGPVSYERAVEVMDVLFGYTRSEVRISRGLD